MAIRTRARLDNYQVCTWTTTSARSGRETSTARSARRTNRSADQAP